MHTPSNLRIIFPPLHSSSVKAHSLHDSKTGSPTTGPGPVPGRSPLVLGRPETDQDLILFGFVFAERLSRFPAYQLTHPIDYPPKSNINKAWWLQYMIHDQRQALSIFTPSSVAEMLNSPHSNIGLQVEINRMKPINERSSSTQEVIVTNWRNVHLNAQLMCSHNFRR